MKPRYIFASSFAALVAQGRYTTLVLRSFGMDDEEVGFVVGTGLLVGAAIVPFWSRFADSRSALQVLKYVLLGHGITVLFYFFAPYFPDDAMVWYTLVVRMVAMGFIQALSPMADAYALRRLSGSRELYGRERAFGSFSWGVSAIAVGAIMTYIPPVWAMCLSTTVATILTLYLLSISESDMIETTILKPTGEEAGSTVPLASTGTTGIEEGGAEPAQKVGTVHPEDDTENMEKVTMVKPKLPSAVQEKRERPRVSMLSFLRNSAFTTHVFLAIMLVLEMGQALTESLEFLFIVESLGASPMLCGVAVFAAVILEVPLLFNSAVLLRRGGILALMLIGIFAFCVRIFVYTLLSSDSPWLILSVEPLNGIYVSLIKMSSVSFMSQASPLGQEGTSMGTLNVARALGQFLGTVIGGAVLEQYGSTVLYRSFGILILMAAMALIALFRGPKLFSGGTIKGAGEGGAAASVVLNGSSSFSSSASSSFSGNTAEGVVGRLHLRHDNDDADGEKIPLGVEGGLTSRRRGSSVETGARDRSGTAGSTTWRGQARAESFVIETHEPVSEDAMLELKKATVV